jgi:two-component system chemotaxis sensor kinase CheA
MTEPDPIVKEFLVESYENLDQLDRDFVALEQNPQDPARLGSVFRTIHTVKGTCGFFGFGKLEAVAHVGENLLCRVRDGEIVLNPEITTALLALVDVIRGILARIESTGEEGDGDYSDLIATLTRLASGPATPPTPQPSPTPDPHPAQAEPALESAAVEAIPSQTDPAPESTATDPEPAQIPNQPPAKSARKRTPKKPTIASPATEAEPVRSPTKPARKRTSKKPTIASPEPAALPPPPMAPSLSSTPVPKVAVQTDSPVVSKATQPADGPPAAALADSNVRVDVGLLDKLMNLVGELVLARNQILQYAPGHKDAGLLRTSQRLNLITSELQEGVMKTRMQPIGTIWNRFPRVVRDLASMCGKQVRVEMDGQDTELDRTIIEAIKDPLTHVVRNSVDHGIETPAVRVAAGKPAEGRLHLRAYHEGGQVNIEISDDGGGVRPDKVRAKALSRGLIEPDRAERMTDKELTQLIFLPGFSTAETVSNISGRGVGMDVVKTNIEKIGGTVDLTSQVGIGTTLKIKIPLTLAIVPALIVTCGGDRYAIPQSSLLELVRLDGDQARGRVESFQGAPVYRLRGNLLPLVSLGELLRVDTQPHEGVVTLVVLRADDRQFGLIVDGIHDTEEIVVKPLGKLLQHLSMFAGSTIMGDGRVALILDVLGVAQQAGVAVTQSRPATNVATTKDHHADRQTMLLVGLGSERRLAIPLDRVARLEEIPAAEVEWADGQEVFRYRGEILPLLRVHDLLGGVGEPPPPADVLQVIVVAEGGHLAGLVVGRILDAVETTLVVSRGSRRSGLVGSTVIQDRVTDVVDVPALLELADPIGV